MNSFPGQEMLQKDLVGVRGICFFLLLLGEELGRVEEGKAERVEWNSLVVVGVNITY